MTSAIIRKHVLLAPNEVVHRSDGSESRFLRLPHPRTRLAALFLPCPVASTSAASPSDQLLELQAVKPDSDKARCYFVDQEVLSDGTLSLLTPFDPLFLIIALLSLLPPHYLPVDELWESASQLSYTSPLEPVKKGQEPAEDHSFAEDIIRFGQMDCVRRRMKTVCDVQVHAAESLYRLSSALAIDALKAKIAGLTDPRTGIFGPLESTELGRLDLPKTEDIQVQDVAEGSATPVDEEPLHAAGEGKVFPTVSRGLGREGVGDGQGMSVEIQIETRAKSAIGILSNYLPPATSHSLLAAYSFPALTQHLSTISTSSVLSSTYLPGRSSSSASLDADSESGGGNGGGAAAAAAKKKKAASKGSRGVEMLKKAQIKGMKTMDTFFSKAPPKVKAAGTKRKAA